MPFRVLSTLRDGWEQVMKLVHFFRSPEWRARVSARVGKKLLGLARRTPKKSPVLIAGLQRSGTTMLMDIFHLHPEADVYDEARSSRTFQDFRIRSLDALRQGVDASHFQFPCFKVIADSHLVPAMMNRLSNPSALWMYREPGPNAASRLKKFGQATAAIRAVCDGKSGGGWFAEGVSETAARRLRGLDRSRFTDFDYACLVWWVRNQLYFELGLANDPRVRLLRYERLVVDPESTMRSLCWFIGMRFSSPTMRFVHAQSLHRANLPVADPQVAALCGELLQRLDREHGRQWARELVRREAPVELSLAC